MIVKVVASFFGLLILIGAFRFFNHEVETMEAIMVVKAEVGREEMDEFLAVFISVGNENGLVLSKTVSENSKGIDVVTLQLKKNDAIEMLVSNSLIDNMISVYFYGTEADSLAILEEVERALNGEWVLIKE